jgi:flagellar basal body-associated protein FliL
MNGRGTADNLDKRKALVFVILVAIAVMCVCVLVYVLFYARPHTTPAIQSGRKSNSMIRRTVPPDIRLVSADYTVHS